MLLSKLAAVASVAVLFSFSTLVGCAASSSDTDETAASSTAALDSDEAFFKLYDAAATAEPACDLHTVLSLTHQRVDGELRAHLNDMAGGACRIAIDADVREYVVVLTGTDCGSKIYKGKATNGAPRAITIVDNRERICNDYVPAIVVDEADAKGAARTLQASAK